MAEKVAKIPRAAIYVKKCKNKKKQKECLKQEREILPV
jgi:hypothetical protein